MGSLKKTDIDVQRVWQLYQVKGTSINDIAFSLQTTATDIRAALAMHARNERIATRQEIIDTRGDRAERKLFELMMPDWIADDSAWKGWLARSKLKPRR